MIDLCRASRYLLAQHRGVTSTPNDRQHGIHRYPVVGQQMPAVSETWPEPEPVPFL